MPTNKKLPPGFAYESSESEPESEGEIYNYPVEKIVCKKQKHEPRGTQWIHDKQVNDVISSSVAKKAEILEKLLQLEFPPQRSPEWKALRFGKATASDGGCILDMNHHEAPYKFLIKKVLEPPFEPNVNCYHGTKLEKIATMVYEYRMNVIVEDFGLIAHPKYSFLAASPDGIIGKYKQDGKSLTKYVGRMLEIKCPTRRKINTSGEIFGHICPEYYWAQVQLQLECCNLEECDFWQCEIKEYENRNDFISDTDLQEPFRSKKSGMEKGCLIQLIPSENPNKKEYLETVYECSKFLYPPKIEMSPLDCDLWISDTMSKFSTLCPEGYKFDKVIYWKLVKTHCVLIERDKKWFKENVTKIRKMWDYVEYLRENKDDATIFFDYIDSLYPKSNKKIMDFMEMMYNKENDSEYAKKIVAIKNKINEHKKKVEMDKLNESDSD